MIEGGTVRGGWSLLRRNPLAHHASIGTSAPEFAAGIARYSERLSDPVEFALRESMR